MADNMDKIKCPACGEEMVKVFMPQQGVNIDVCVNGCGGIYFDNREFSKFDEPHEDITPLVEVLKDKEFKEVNSSEKRKCPVCGADMVKNYASAAQEIEIDECYSCGGKFLDYKELDKIRTQYRTEEERARDVIKKLYAEAGLDLAASQLPRAPYTRDWIKGAVKGAVFGIIIDILLWYSNKEALASMPGNTALSYCAVMSAGICLICAGAGALFSKADSNRPCV